MTGALVGTIMAIDPGSTESAYVIVDPGTCRPLFAAKVPNEQMLRVLTVEAWTASFDVRHLAIEMVASYGMPVGAEVFDTCVWIGRFRQAVEGAKFRLADTELVYRKPVKLHHCGTATAKDSNITQALVDRFAKGEPNRGKGTKADPGWFHGFKRDIWQSYALAVYVADTRGTP